MPATLAKPPNRLSWRVGLQNGLSRSEAVVRAADRVFQIQDQLRDYLEETVSRLATVITNADETDESAVNEIYEISSTVGGIAGTVGLDPMTSVAYGLCDLVDERPRLGGPVLLACVVHLECMLRMRKSYGSDFPNVVNALQSLRDAAQRAPAHAAEHARVLSFTYGSSPTIDARALESSLGAIVNTAGRKNAVAGVSGLLVVHSNWVLQCLEGSPHALGPVISSLLFDKRHDDIKVIAVTANTERMFPHWSMRLAKLCGDFPDVQMAAGASFRPQNLQGDQATAMLIAVSQAMEPLGSAH